MDVYSILRKFPFVRVLLFYIAAILVTFKYHIRLFQFEQWIVLITILLSASTVILVVTKRLLKLADFLIPATVFSISVLLSLHSIPHPDSFKNNGPYIGKLLERPELKTNSTLLKIRLLPSDNMESRQIVLISTRRDSLFTASLKPGSIISFEGKPERIRNFNNPGEFDYARYMAIRGAWYRIYLNPDKIEYHPNQKPAFFITRFADKIRGFVLHSTEKHIHGAEESGVVRALTIGVRNEIPEELNQSYRNAGVVHVLSISGLHVGIIYMIINFILGIFGQNKHFSILKIGIIIAIIWFYALLSGFSPSVVRASVMFTLLSLGKMLNRDISSFNTLAASALFILAFNPLLIYDIGFQLSYLAVAGILHFQPVFYNLFRFTNIIADYFWGLVSVSLAAQLVTAPLTIYYFHQFPVYFLLANILIIPLIFLILCGSVLMLSFSFFSKPAVIIAYLVEKLTWLTNQVIIWIDSLPGGLIGGLVLTKLQLIILYLILIALVIWQSLKKSRMAFPILILLVLFLVIPVSSALKKNHEELICIYNVPGKLYAGFYLKQGNYLFANNISAKDKKYLLQMSQSHRIKPDSKSEIIMLPFDSLTVVFSNYQLPPANNAIIWLNDKQQLAFITKQPRLDEWKSFKKVKIMVISGKVWPPENFKTRTKVIIAPDLDYQALTKWKKLSDQNPADYYFIKNQGAYSYRIEP